MFVLYALRQRPSVTVCIGELGSALSRRNHVRGGACLIGANQSVARTLGQTHEQAVLLHILLLGIGVLLRCEDIQGRWQVGGDLNAVADVFALVGYLA